MEDERPFDNEYDSDEPLILGGARRTSENEDDSDEPFILRSAKRPVESDDDNEEHQAKKAKTDANKSLTSHFGWMDAIHNTTKYGMQNIVDEMQERIDELGEELATSKEVARLAYTANVALGSLTVKHTELTRSKEVLQEELSSVKEAMAAIYETERENHRLREELLRANDRLALMEATTEKLTEQHRQSLKARGDQIRMEHAEQAKTEAWSLKTAWEDWCKSKKLSLDKKARIIIEGDINFADHEMKMAIEIIRRSDSENKTLFQNFIWTARPGLEYETYPTDPLPDSKMKEIIAIHQVI
ncbi:hypothetical protein N431DRAFT_461452 [Stipitochalara longipes BDJ]|nr:hypothetical protein N431DRAFT_461452 [Stipitochalara longipes BDJ]